MKITTAYLKQLGTCKAGIDAFNRLFPSGIAELNSYNISKAMYSGLDVAWLLERIDDQNVLVTLSKDDSEWVRRGVANNRNTPLDVLAQLSNDESAMVRCGVAWNPNAPLDVLAKLSKDESAMVRNEAANNPNTPQGTTNEAETR